MTAQETDNLLKQLWELLRMRRIEKRVICIHEKRSTDEGYLYLQVSWDIRIGYSSIPPAPFYHALFKTVSLGAPIHSITINWKSAGTHVP